MRLIDADKIEPHEHLESFGFSNGRAEFAMVAYMDDIDALPTVDAVPVKRGYWKMVTMSEATGYDPGLSGNDPPYGHVCSVCKHEARLNEEEEEILSNFCPDCGAILVEKGGSE